MSNTEFTEWLQKELDNREWNNSDLAKKAGVNPAHISRIFSGSRKPGKDLIIGLSGALGYSPDEIMRKAGYLPKMTGINWQVEEAQYLITLLPEDILPVIIKQLRSLIPGGQNDQSGGVGRAEN